MGILHTADRFWVGQAGNLGFQRGRGFPATSARRCGGILMICRRRSATAARWTGCCSPRRRIPRPAPTCRRMR